MLKNVLVAGFAAASMAGIASAQTTGTVDVTGSVGDRCEFSSNSALITLGELSITGAGTSAGQLDASQVDGMSASLVGWCNGSLAEMSVQAFQLTNQDFVGAPPTGFERLVHFTATATATTDEGDVSASDVTTPAGAGAPVSVGIFSSTIDVVLSNSSTPAGGKLIAGGYEGSVVVTLSPGV